MDKFGEAIPAAPPPAPALPELPADALPGVARFRALLGTETRLSYRAAEPIDPATGSVRLLGATLTREGGKAEIEELTLDGLAEARIGAASAREVTLTLGRHGEPHRPARAARPGGARRHGRLPGARVPCGWRL